MTARLHVWLGHGASGTAASMRPHVEGLRARGLPADALSLPKGSAERAMPRLLEQVGDDRAAAVIGGHSYGGRVASMVAAQGAGVAGLVLLSYPAIPSSCGSSTGRGSAARCSCSAAGRIRSPAPTCSASTPGR